MWGLRLVVVVVGPRKVAGASAWGNLWSGSDAATFDRALAGWSQGGGGESDGSARGESRNVVVVGWGCEGERIGTEGGVLQSNAGAVCTQCADAFPELSLPRFAKSLLRSFSPFCFDVCVFCVGLC